MALTRGVQYDSKNVFLAPVEYPVGASQTIYQGALLEFDTAGTILVVQNVAGTAGDGFAGIALEDVDNSGGSDGDKTIQVQQSGDWYLPYTSPAITLVLDAIRASDENTLTTSGASNPILGQCKDVPDTSVNKIWVRFYIGYH